MDEGPMAAALSSEDILLLILSRLADHLDLICCAATCTRWFRLVASPPFRLWPPGGRPPSAFLLGIFSQRRSRVATKNGYFPPRFSRLAGTEMSFFPGADDELSFNYAMPLASRSGLLLLRVDHGKDDSKLHLLVCNPLVGRRSACPIPPPPFLSGDPDLDVTGYALLTTLDLHPQQQRQPQLQPAFQVLLTVLEYDKTNMPLLYAYAYSTWTGSWSRSAPIKADRCLTPSGRHAGIVIVSPDATAVVHWLYRDWARFYTLDISGAEDPDDIHVSLTAIPRSVVAVPVMDMPLPRPLLCHIARSISLIRVVYMMQRVVIELWTKEDDDWTRRWCFRERRKRSNTKLVAFAESRGAMLVEQGHALLALDLQTMQTETMMTCSGEPRPWGFNASVLYEMDWPSYILHLFLSAQQAS